MRKFLNTIFIIFLILFQHQISAQEQQFNELMNLDWKEVFADKGDGDWQKQWFLDGQRASIRNMVDGMLFSAGPIERDNASHAVLWTKDEFEGDLKIEYDFTRMDAITKYVNIIYIQATGKQEGPYVKDIAQWSDLRIIPYMSSYFKNMKLWHVSYAAYGNDDAKDKVDYVRARRYPILPGKTFNDTKVGTSYDDSGLFKPGKMYHMTFIKRGDRLYMKVEGEGLEKFFSWDFSDHPGIKVGRVGLRQMSTRCSKYANFSVCVLG